MAQFLVATLINGVKGSTELYPKNLFSYSIFKVLLYQGTKLAPYPQEKFLPITEKLLNSPIGII